MQHEAIVVASVIQGLPMHDPSCRPPRSLPIWHVACRKDQPVSSRPCIASRSCLPPRPWPRSAAPKASRPAIRPSSLTVMEQLRRGAALRTTSTPWWRCTSADGVFMRERLAGRRSAREAAAGRLSAGVRHVEARSALRYPARPRCRATWPGCARPPRVKIRALATGADADESFNELVVFRREGGAWKIRCYLYASNKPGTGTPAVGCHVRRTLHRHPGRPPLRHPSQVGAAAGRARASASCPT